jgi:hypothetical protein
LKFPSSPSWHTATCNMELGTVLPSVQRILSARSRAEASRDDKVSGFRGRLYGMTVFFCFALSSCFWPSSRSWF